MTSRPPAPPSVSGWPMYERSLLSNVLGLPGYAAITIAFGFTALGVFIDLNRINDLGAIFKGCYFAGCVLAVCWVKRRALFAPMVNPPLLLAVALPAVVLLGGSLSSSGSPGMADHLLSIGAPLLSKFPTMAVTTAFTVGVGVFRYLMQRPASRRTGPPPSRIRPGDERPAIPAARRGTVSGVPGERRPPASAERRSRGDGAGTATPRRTSSGTGGTGGTAADGPRERSRRPSERTGEKQRPAENATTKLPAGQRSGQPKKPPGERKPAGDRKPPSERKPPAERSERDRPARR